MLSAMDAAAVVGILQCVVVDAAAVVGILKQVGMDAAALVFALVHGLDSSGGQYPVDPDKHFRAW